ncbi:MAG: SPOR domain-containing protein, partial [Cytophagaceae bacterium]
MKYTLKHRLVGAAVLAAVAVLFLPGFFKDKQAQSVNTKSQIPARPNITPEEFRTPQPVPDIEPAPAPEEMFVPPEAMLEPPSVAVTSSDATSSKSSSSKAASASVAPSSVAHMPLNAKGIPDAWIVQVGGFTTKEAANKLRDELQADGHKAYVRTTTADGKSISRVYIG